MNILHFSVFSFSLLKYFRHTLDVVWYYYCTKYWLYCCTDWRDGLWLYVSRWNELRSSSTVPFFGRSAGWSGGEAFGQCKEQYSTMHECCSTCLSNYGSGMHHRYIMAPPPTPKSYKYSSPFGLGVCGWWERFSRSGVHRIGNPGIVCRPQTQPRVVAHPWDPSRSLDDLYNKLIL